MTQLPDYYDDIGPGWRSILESLHVKLQTTLPNYTIGQVKEKFGGLRVYGYPTSGESEFEDTPEDDEWAAWTEAIRWAEFEAAQTCESCGAPGVARTTNYWIKTLCDDCEGRSQARREQMLR